MGSPEPDVIKKGYDITLAPSGFTYQILKLTLPQKQVEDVEISYMGQSDVAKLWMPSSQIDWSEFTVDVHFSPDFDVPVGIVQTSITITHSSTATWVWASGGYIKSASPSEIDIKGADALTMALVIKTSGDMVKTNGA